MRQHKWTARQMKYPSRGKLIHKSAVNIVLSIVFLGDIVDDCDMCQNESVRHHHALVGHKQTQVMEFKVQYEMLIQAQRLD